MGIGKILAVLEVKLDHYLRNEGAPTLANINCAAISVAASWTGESIAEFLQQVIRVIGKPAAYLFEGQASKKLKQSILACLIPPKISTKARFMNIHRLAEWAQMILQHSPKGRAAKDSLIDKFRNPIGKPPEYKQFINLFLRDDPPLLEC